MAIGVRDLKNRTSEIIRDVEESGDAVMVTRHGRPAVLMLPMDSPEAEDYVLAHAPEIVASLRDAERAYKAGKTTSLRAARKSLGI